MNAFLHISPSYCTLCTLRLRGWVLLINPPTRQSRSGHAAGRAGPGNAERPHRCPLGARPPGLVDSVEGLRIWFRLLLFDLNTLKATRLPVGEQCVVCSDLDARWVQV